MTVCPAIGAVVGAILDIQIGRKSSKETWITILGDGKHEKGGSQESPFVGVYSLFPLSNSR